MKSTILNKMMKSEVIEKTAIFADLFNLNITGFRTREPNRIELVSDNVIVGYIDAVVNKLSPNDIETNMPITLYTPIGKVEGYYSTHFQLFKYEVLKREGEFEKIDGLFEVTSKKESKEKYKISSHMSLTKEDGTRTQLISNCLAGNYLVEINKSGKDNSETARLYLKSGNLCLDHFHYPRFNEREFYSKIKIDLNGETRNPINFEFKDEKPYKRYVKLPIDKYYYLPAFRKVDYADYNEIREDIDLFDERLGQFIDEVREDYTILANGITPISLYDKQARLSFHGEKDKFKLGFSRASELKTTLDSNKVLKKTDNK